MAIGLSRQDEAGQAPPDPAEPPVPARRKSRKRRPLATGVAVALVLVVAGLVGWIALRGYLARQELYAALPAAHGIQSAIVAGDLASARASADELEKRASSAAALTSAPVWRAAELVPWAGPNLAAVRTAAAATERVASRVIQPLVGVAGSAVERLRTLFAEATPAVDAVGNSARLLPAMLGADGPRSYLLVAQNPAELRATGGLIGSVALIRADHGAV